MKVPMHVTFFRLILIPIFVVIFYLPWGWAHIASAIIFAIAGISDWLDGFLARKLNQETRFGAFLDPVADKLMVVTALILLVGDPHLPYIALPAAVIAGREIAISALREWMAEIGQRTNVAVNYVGKIKTTAQILAIIVLLAAHPLYSRWLPVLGYILLYTAAILTLWSMVMYLKAAWHTFEIE